MTIIKHCSRCAESTTSAARYQNEKYKGARVFNASGKTGKDAPAPTCTVCGARS